MIEQILHGVVALFVIIDPVGSAAIFAALMRGAPEPFRRRMAWRGTLVAGLLILAFAFVGAPLLGALGITLPAFRVAGGVLLFLLAVDMVFARPSGIRNPTAREEEEAEHRADISVFPLAFPLLAGPGALTSIVLLMARARSPLDAAGIILALVIVMAAALALLLSASHVVRLLGVTGTNVVGRVLGIVLAALAAQYVLDGIAQVLMPLR
ncbi:MAG TPA: MarC family protein [Stellaceae bacterium]|nr:MarC family protein [Stellaceae bacterium]